MINEARESCVRGRCIRGNRKPSTATERCWSPASYNLVAELSKYRELWLPPATSRGGTKYLKVLPLKVTIGTLGDAQCCCLSKCHSRVRKSKNVPDFSRQNSLDKVRKSRHWRSHDNSALNLKWNSCLQKKWWILTFIFTNRNCKNVYSLHYPDSF